MHNYITFKRDKRDRNHSSLNISIISKLTHSMELYYRDPERYKILSSSSSSRRRNWKQLLLRISKGFSSFFFPHTGRSITEDQLDYCCSLGTNYANEGLKCDTFTGPAPNVPKSEQTACLDTVDGCCVTKYNDKQCEKGKANAKAGNDCAKGSTAKRVGRGDHHKDCCEGCKSGEWNDHIEIQFSS